MTANPPSTNQRLAVRQRPADQKPVMRQRWGGLLFLHWQVDPQEIQRRLPAGLHVDTFENKAWLGVVPFFMQRVRPVFLPPLPRLSWFLELNVRTYVHDSSGRPGVWFFSLDCNQPLAVEIARRRFHLPYEHASMHTAFRNSKVEYTCRRKNSDGQAATYEYPLPTHTKPADEGSLEWFLVERYLLFSSDRQGNLHSGQVHHTPYQIQQAPESTGSTLPLRWNNFTEPVIPPASTLIANPVDVEIFPLKACGKR